MFLFIAYSLLIFAAVCHGEEYFSDSLEAGFRTFLASPNMTDRLATKMLGKALSEEQFNKIASDSLGDSWNQYIHGSVKEFYTKLTDGLQPEATGHTEGEATLLQVSFMPDFMLLAFEDACGVYNELKKISEGYDQQEDKDRAFQELAFPVFAGYSGGLLMVHAETGAVHQYDSMEGLTEQPYYDSLADLVEDTIDLFNNGEYIVYEDGEVDEANSEYAESRKKRQASITGLLAGLRGNGRFSTGNLANVAKTVKNAAGRPYTKYANKRKTTLYNERRSKLNLQQSTKCMLSPGPRVLWPNCVTLPNICAGITDALSNCNPAWIVLTYVGVYEDGKGKGKGKKKDKPDPIKDINGRYSCGRARRAVKSLKSFLVKLTCDEFPFRSTLQGGVGAYINFVTRLENSAQGGQLNAFYTRHRKECPMFSFTIAVADLVGFTGGETGICPAPVVG